MHHVSGESANAPDSLLDIATRHNLETLAWAVDLDAGIDSGFYESILSRTARGVVLEAGCGAGRLLISLLRAGFVVEGCDNSPAMLSLCRFNAEAAGYRPLLHLGSFQELPFTERYSVILLACGTFMCLTGAEEIDRCLRILHTNLIPGGRLVISLIMPSYLHLAAGPFPTPWESYYRSILPHSAGTLVVDWRATMISMTEQVVSEECRYRWIVGDSVVRQEISPGRHRWYNRDQLLTHLHRIGFRAVEIYPDYSDQPSAREPDAVLSFVATRAGTDG